MTDFIVLIREKNEDTDFDLKSVIYKPEMKLDFLKDVMAMANANISSDRFIILGVSLDKVTRKRDLVGIDETEIHDPSEYQSWAHEFIEPKIDLNFFPFSHDGKTFGIIKISNCIESPYIIKKEFSDQKGGKRVLHVGEAWIRKNSKQERMNRLDLENIYKKRMEKHGFSGEVRILFSNFESDTYVLHPFDEMLLPSKKDYEKILKIIARKNQNQKTSSFVENAIITLKNVVGRYLSWDRKFFKMDLDELVEYQQQILENYSDDDYYQIFGIWTNRVNIIIENLGEEYIEDASIRMIFPTKGLAISDHEPKIHSKPIFTLANPCEYYRKQLYGNEVLYGYHEFELTKELGRIRHGLPTKIFDDVLRISINKSSIGKIFTIKCYLHGKNLKKPIYRELFLKCS